MAKPDPKAPAGPKKSSTLAEVISEVGSVHGPNIVRQASLLPAFKHLPTGIFTLDMALFGGFPESLISMLVGWESSGKSTVSDRVIAAAQRKYSDKQAVKIDVEGTHSNAWSACHGVDVDRLVVAQPETGEQALDIADAVIRARDTSVVVLDSIPALTPTKELENSAEDVTVALQARLIGTFLRKATQAVIDERKKGHLVTLILVNQFRSKISYMGGKSLPGGNALKYFVSVKVELTCKESAGRDAHDVETVDFNEHTFTVGKNKVGVGIRTGEFSMIRNPSHPLGQGFIDDGRTVITYAKKFDLFTGGGTAWRLDGVDKKFGKMQDAVDWLYSDPEQFEALKNRLISIQREHCGLRPEWS